MTFTSGVPPPTARPFVSKPIPARYCSPATPSKFANGFSDGLCVGLILLAGASTGCPTGGAADTSLHSRRTGRPPGAAGGRGTGLSRNDPQAVATAGTDRALHAGAGRGCDRRRLVDALV